MLAACTAGYIWVYLGIELNLAETNSAEVCLFKYLTNIPCPSCGSTRSVISIIKGDFATSILINPFGFIIVFIMLVAPAWIIIDIITKKKTLFNFYQEIELILKNPQYAIPLALLVMINWIWNITKEL